MKAWQWALLIVITILIIVAGVMLFVIPAKAPTVSAPQTTK